MEELFKKYIRSVLNPEEFSKLSAYLSDKTHEEEVFRMMKPYWDRHIRGEVELPEANRALLAKIMQVIELDEGKATQQRLKIYTWGLRIAAVLVVGLLVSTVFLSRNRRQIIPAVAPLVVQKVSIPNGARTQFLLPDSSYVWLNSGSELSFPSGFGETRQVALAGEAFFEVAKNGQPFIVSTKYGEVKVTGTSFNAKAYEEEAFVATLVSGSVQLKDAGTGNEVTLRPGQQAVLTGNHFTTENVATDEYTSWKDGILIFRHEYLPEVAARLERWYNVKIELSGDPRLTKVWYTGTLEMESFSEVLGLLKVTAPIDYTYNEKTRIIRITYRERK